MIKTWPIFRDNVAFSVISVRNFIRVPANIRDKIDFSRVPKVDPKDVDERTHRGSGPGGQAAAKTSYAVTLIHRPTRVTVRCEESRYLFLPLAVADLGSVSYNFGFK